MCTGELVERQCPTCPNKTVWVRYISRDYNPVCRFPTMLPGTKSEDRTCAECEWKEVERKRQQMQNEQNEQVNGGPGYPYLKD
jgi:hypothetical protein